MDDRTRELVTALHEAPNAPGRLEAARAHLMATGKPGSVAKLLEWWAGKAADKVAACGALVDAARITAPSDAARAKGLLERAIDTAAENPTLRDLGAILKDDQAATQLFAKRLQVLSDQRAELRTLIGAYSDYARTIASAGRLDDALDVILRVADKGREAALLAIDLLEERGQEDDLRRAVRLLRLQSRERPADAETLLTRAFEIDPSDRGVVADLESRLDSAQMPPIWTRHLEALGGQAEADTRIKLARAFEMGGRVERAVEVLKPFEQEPSIGAELTRLKGSRREASRVALLADLEAELASAPPPARSEAAKTEPRTAPAVPPKAPGFPKRAPAPTIPSAPSARPSVTPPTAFDDEESTTVMTPEEVQRADPSAKIGLVGAATDIADIPAFAVQTPDPSSFDDAATNEEALPTSDASDPAWTPDHDLPAPVGAVGEPVPSTIAFDASTLTPFEDEDEDDDSPMVDIDPRKVIPIGLGKDGGGTRLEIVRLRDAIVLGVQNLIDGERVDDSFPGTVRFKGHSAIVRLMDADRAFHQAKDGTRTEVGNADTTLIAGERLEVERGGLSWVLQTDTGRPIARGARVLPWMAYAIGTVVALVSHFSLGASIEYLAAAGVVSLEVEDRPQEEIFAEARLIPPEQRPPRPPPRRPRRVRRTKAPTPPETRAELSQNLRNRLRRARTSAPSTGDATQDLVNRLTTPNAGSGQTLQDVTTNIAAVAGGPGSSNLSVTGVQSSLAGVGGVNTARASGSANVGPLGGSDAAGSVMGLEMRASMGRVRGRVRAVSALGRQTGGSLSRGEVTRVINGKMGRIQRCYERALLTNANISGRVSFAWTIAPNGRVRGVRQASSTLGSTAVSNCVAGVIRSMRFPRPQGGAVSITYPFIFQH